MKSVCVDVDGVLAKYDGWKGIDHIGNPIPGVVEFTKELAKNYRIVIYTTRCNPEVNKLPAEVLVEKVQRWLDDHGFEYDEIHVGKPICVAFVDDRAIGCIPQQWENEFQNVIGILEDWRNE